MAMNYVRVVSQLCILLIGRQKYFNVCYYVLQCLQYIFPAALFSCYWADTYNLIITLYRCPKYNVQTPTIKDAVSVAGPKDICLASARAKTFSGLAPS